MKKLIFIFSIVVLIPFFGSTQVIDSINYISPFHDGFASIQKDSEWAIIDEEGTIVIDFRGDLVSLKIKNDSYPAFISGRCLIKEIKDDVTYFGYININGDIVVEPQFINATNFKYDKAIVTKLVIYELGYNSIMEKPIVSYKYREIVIDSSGNLKNCLTEEKPLSYLKPFIKIPIIHSKIISKNLVIIKNEMGELILRKI